MMPQQHVLQAVQKSSTANDKYSLPPLEVRIVGTLLEKELTTPDTYPLTVNSLITGCNQKTSREPVTNYQLGEIVRSLRELNKQGLIRHHNGARSDRYSQLLGSTLKLTKHQQAIMSVILLRGPQTLSELHTRTQRMAICTSKTELLSIITTLISRQDPLLIELPHSSGQRGERFGHLIGAAKPTRSVGPLLRSVTSKTSLDHESKAAAQLQSTLHPVAQNSPIETKTDNSVEGLKNEIVELKNEIDRLQSLNNHGPAER